MVRPERQSSYATVRGDWAPAGPLRMAAGLVAAVAAVAVGHGLAALTSPADSPLLAVGSALIDLTPTPVKTAAVRVLGTYDKPVLVGGIAVLLAGFAAAIGLVAWRHRRIALGGIGLLGAAGALAAVRHGGISDAIPSIVAGVVGIGVLALCTRRPERSGAGADVVEGEGAAEPARSSSGPTRRALLAGLLVGGALAGAGGLTALIADQRRAGLAALRQKLGLPRPASPATPIPGAAQVPGDTPFLTSTQDFYRVDVSLTTPEIPVEAWSLTIDGMVDRPLTLTYADLLALPLIERNITLTCVSNEVGGPYVSTARWLGVPFTELIRRIGVQPGVDQVYAYSLDSDYTCSTPYAAVSDGRDAMIVVGMNGEVLPAKNGFPARMLVPGLYGFVSGTKWLKRLEFTTYARRTAYWTERGWATDAPILVQSRIDVPKSLGRMPGDKRVLAGVAWAQHRGIAKVEVQIDDGPWLEAVLAADAGIDLWRQWYLPYDGPAGRHTAQVRATSMTGEVQPQARTKVFPRGATGWHQIQFLAE